MESLSHVLQPHKEIVGFLASVVTILQFFSGAFVCKDIKEKGTTKDVSITPFVGGVAIGILMLKHGFLMNDPVMIQVNVVAIFLNTLYTIFFYFYTADKFTEFYKPVAVAIAVVAVFIGYTEIESPEKVEYRYGLILTILMLALLGAPLMNVKKIIDEKDASSIPFPITVMAALTTFLWLFYGIILMNEFMIIQNVVGLALCAVQLVLIFKFPKSPTPSKKEKRGKTE